MKLGKKLTIMIVSIVFLGIGTLVTVVLNTARKEINALVNKEITDIADKQATEIETWFENYMSTIRTISEIMAEGAVELEDWRRRSTFDMILRGVLKASPDIAAVASCWEPNALDGNDAEYAGTPGSDRTGRFISYWAWTEEDNIAVSPLLNYDIPGQGDFYLAARDSGNETIMEPYYYAIDGEDELITTLTVPIFINDQIPGAALLDISIQNIQNRVSGIQPYQGTIAAVFSSQGIVAGHFDRNRVGAYLMETELELNEQSRGDLLNAVKEGRQFSFVNTSSLNGQNYLFVLSPIEIGTTSTPWALMLGIPMGIVNGPVLKMLQISIPIIVVMLLLITAAAIFMARRITLPLKSMMTSFSMAGEGDLTQKLDIHSSDEIGDISGSFNQTMEKIKHLIITIKRHTANLFNIGGQMAANMKETAAAVNEITANIQSIRGRMLNQSAGVTETSTTMEQITGNINKLNSLIEEQSSGVSRSSSAIEQMLANIQSVTKTLIKNAESVTDLSEASEVGRRGLEAVASDIQEIARESEGLLEINSVMENIASQTNLLSMNAAIEAAHAGEAGKGFAVVADEIRKLAESSGKQSKTISKVLKKIKGSIDKITESTGNVLNKFEAIDRGVKIVADQEGSIRNAMEAQGEGSKQILDAIAMLNDITGQVKNGSGEMLEGAKEIIEESRNLELASQEISTGMNEMAGSADQINSAVQQINEVSGQNKESIDILVKEVSRFTVG
ncbi:MAG: methyl-accepting chemotaxis protein [Treponema sp.]|nr:methyl-accepting chemotaxis protein [Treponema sp.]